MVIKGCKVNIFFSYPVAYPIKLVTLRRNSKKHLK